MFKNMFKGKRINQRLLALGILMGAAFIIYIYHPATPLTMSRCPFREMTGLYCPGCGSIRALTQLLQGNLLAAAAHNILAVIFTPLMLWAGISCVLLLIVGKPLPAPDIPSKAIWALLTVLIVFAVARNLPIAQLQFLQP